MEHRDRDSLNDLLGMESEETDFETFLKEKVDTCSIDVIAEMRTTPIDLPTAEMRREPSQTELLEKFPGLKRTQSANAAEGIAPSVLKSVLDENVELSSSPHAESADEKTMRLELRQRPILGSDKMQPYVSETVVSVSSFDPQNNDAISSPSAEQFIESVVEPATIDSEVKKLFTESIRIGLGTPPELIIERIHELMRGVVLVNIQVSGLRIALEEVLKATTHTERMRLLEMDRQHRVKAKAKASNKVAKVKAPASPKGPKSQTMKHVDAMRLQLGYSEQTIIDKVTGMGKMDDAVMAYIKKSFAS